MRFTFTYDPVYPLLLQVVMEMGGYLWDLYFLEPVLDEMVLVKACDI